MPFRYSLQSILNLRRSLERQEEQHQFAAAALVARLRAQMEELEERRFAQKRQALQELGAGGSGAVFQFMAACDSVYEQTKRILGQQLDQAEKQRLTQLEKYKQARQKREILEGLRDRQEEQYTLEFTRHEQQRTDEAFLIRTFTHPAE